MKPQNIALSYVERGVILVDERQSITISGYLGYCFHFHEGEAKAVVQDIAEYERTQQTLALLKILSLGRRQIEEGRVRPAAEVFSSMFIHSVSPIELKSQDQHSVVDDPDYQPPVADPVAPQPVQIACEGTSEPSGLCSALKVGGDVSVQQLSNVPIHLFYPPRKGAVDFHPVPCHSSSQSRRAST